MCLIEFITCEKADGTTFQRSYTRLCQNSVDGQPCENTTIRDSGSAEDRRAMAHDKFTRPGPASPVEVTSVVGDSKRSGKKYFIRPKAERTSLFGGLLRRASTKEKKEKEKHYHGGRLPDRSAALAAENPAGAPPPPLDTNRQSWPSGAPNYPTGYEMRSDAYGQPSPIHYERVPARPPPTRQTPHFANVVHQTQFPQYPDTFLPQGMSPTDSQFSSSPYPESRHSSPFGHPFGQAQAPIGGRGTNLNTPLEADPAGYDRMYQPNYGSNQSQYDPYSYQYRPAHHRAASDGQNLQPSFGRGRHHKPSSHRATSSGPAYTDHADDAARAPAAYGGTYRRRRQTEEEKRDRELAKLRKDNDNLRSRLQALESEPILERTSSMSTDKTVRPGTSPSAARAGAQPQARHSRFASDPTRDLRGSSSDLSPSETEEAKDSEIQELREESKTLKDKIEALEDQSATSAPSSASRPKNPYAAYVTDAEDEDDGVTHIDSGESAYSAAVESAGPSPSSQAPKRRTSISQDTPASPASPTSTIRTSQHQPRRNTDSKDPSNSRKLRMHERASENRPAIYGSYKDKPSDSRPQDRERSRERSTDPERHRSGRHGSSRHSSRHSSRDRDHGDRHDSDTEGNSRRHRRRSAASEDESERRHHHHHHHRSRRDPRDREESKATNRKHQ